MRPRRLWIVAICLLVASAACGQRTSGGHEETSASPLSVEGGSEASPVAEPVRRAPTYAESIRDCPDPLPQDEMLATLLVDQRYAEVERWFEDLQLAYQRQPSCEIHLSNAVDVVVYRAPLESFHRFAEASPESWLALALRGTALMREGHRARGGGWGRDVKPERWNAMRRLFEAARSDLWRSLELAPENAIATGSLLELAKIDGAQEEVRAILDHVIEHDPLSFRSWARAVRAFEPQWGGSFEQMHRIAAEAEPFMDRNPALRAIPGFADWALGAAFARAGRHEEAIEAQQRALRHAGNPEWWWALCSSAFEIGRYELVVSSANGWIEDSGEEVRAYYWRARARWKLDQLIEARSDFDRAVQIDPTYRVALSTRGQFLQAIGEMELAEEDYRNVVTQYPRDAWALRRLALILVVDPESSTEAEEILRRWLQVEPEKPEAWFHLGTLLHRSGDPESESALARYLSLAKGDTDESRRIARARSLMTPSETKRLPASSLLGLDSGSDS